MTGKGKGGGLPTGKPGTAPSGNADKRPPHKKPNASGYGNGPPEPPKPETK